MADQARPWISCCLLRLTTAVTAGFGVAPNGPPKYAKKDAGALSVKAGGELAAPPKAH
jgi:hypothetical protein